MRAVVTCNNKYKTINDNGILSVYRYNELWKKDELIGDKYVLSLIQQIEQLEDKLNNVINAWDAYWEVMNKGDSIDMDDFIRVRDDLENYVNNLRKEV